jgi:1-acyl-sn-glycerol-3-phosphate acyltransferase
MHKFSDYTLSVIFYFFFALLLLFFHPVQVAAHRLLGERARQRVVNALNFLLLQSIRLLCSRLIFRGFNKIPSGRPVIIVSNHQSMFDIPVIVYGFRRLNPKFISKRELGKGLPSISYNLHHGKSALIDRSDRGQAVKEIIRVGKLIETTGEAVCIFPEGTRSKTGKMKSFFPAGISALLRAAPSAVIVPFVIDGHNRLMKHGAFPLHTFQRITYTVLDPIEPKHFTEVEIVKTVENKIREVLNEC